ncbi:MAG: tetratricopeptide repeat protein [Gemmatimonadetes bacterium]|nr:tetratricopeptide repeat protein [Gemmatimonadota bacterium]
MPNRRTVAFLSLVSLLWVGNACAGPDATPDAAPQEAAERDQALTAETEATSLLGEPLSRPEAPAQVEAERRQQLEEAEATLAADSSSLDAWIWAGRRQAYPGHFRQAIATYSAALERFPDEPHLLRHRGHRYITVRELDEAVADLSRAAEVVAGTEDEVEPDGQPNALGIPTSTLQFNIWYHLGLAHYLQGDFEAALEAYRNCMAVSRHDDSVVATAHWLYMTLRRLGREQEAAQVLADLPENPDVIESTAYLDLLRMYQGRRTPEDLLGPGGEDATLTGTTAAYGVGNWYLYNGDATRARSVFERILTGRSQWPAFGYVAAEAELARMGDR